MSDIVNRSVSRLPRRILISYGLGSAGPTLALEFCGAFLLLFYTELTGLDPVWVGIALLFRMIADAAIDPVIGRWSDQTRSTRGRRRPWILGGSISGLIFLALLFAVPDCDKRLQLIYLIVMSTLMAAGFSAASIPHMAMAFEMSDDSVDRVRIVGYRNTVESFCSLLAMLSGPIALSLQGSHLAGRTLSRADCYGLAAFLISVLGSFTAVSSYCGTREPPLPQRQPPISLIAAFRHSFGNRMFRTVVLVYCLLTIANKAALAQLFLLLEYFHGKSGNETIPLLLSFYAGSLLSMPLWVMAASRIGRLRCLLLSMLLWPSMYVALSVNQWPDPALLTVTFAMGASFAGLLAMLGALVPDTLDQERARTGQRLEGLHASVISLSLQVGLGIGYLLTGISLQLAGYRGGIKPTSEVIDGLRFSTAVFPAVLSIAALIILRRSPLYQGAADEHTDDENARII